MSLTRDFIRTLKKSLFKKSTLSWEKKDDSLIWRISSSTQPKINEVGKVVVRDGEIVALFNSGSFQGLLKTGQHPLSEDYDEVIFIDVTPKTQKIGIRAPDYPFTADSKSFGFSGNIVFKVQEDNASIGNFISKIVDKSTSLDPIDVTKWLRDGILFQVFKDLISNMRYDDFINMDRFNLMLELETRLGFELRDYGLEILSTEIKYFTPPRSF